MDHNFYCEHGRVILIPLKKENVEQVRRLRNLPHIREWFNYSEEISEEEQSKWFTRYLSDSTDYMYVAFLKNNPKQFVGTYASYNLDTEKRAIEVGRLMVDSQNISERGIGYDVVAAGIKIVFENLPVDTITAEVFADNVRAMRCNLEGGKFRITGKKNVEGREVLLLSITRQQYLNEER